MVLLYLSRRYDKSAVVGVIVAGREGDDPLSVLRRDACVIDRQRLDVFYIIVVRPLVVEIRAVVVFEHVLAVVIDLAVEHGEDLIFRLFTTCVESDLRMLFEVTLVLVFRQRAEHRAVEHMVTVDQVVVAVRVALSVHKQLAAFRVIAVKVHMQVLLVLIRRVHDGVIHDGVLDLQPAEEVVVGGVKLFEVLRESRQSVVAELVVDIVVYLDADDRKTRDQQENGNDPDDDDTRRGALLLRLSADVSLIAPVVAAVVIVFVVALVVLNARSSAGIVIIITVAVAVVSAVALRILLTGVAVVLTVVIVLRRASIVILRLRGRIIALLNVLTRAIGRLRRYVKVVLFLIVRVVAAVAESSAAILRLVGFGIIVVIVLIVHNVIKQGGGGIPRHRLLVIGWIIF